MDVDIEADVHDGIFTGKLVVGVDAINTVVVLVAVVEVAVTLVLDVELCLLVLVPTELVETTGEPGF